MFAQRGESLRGEGFHVRVHSIVGLVFKCLYIFLVIPNHSLDISLVEGRSGQVGYFVRGGIASLRTRGAIDKRKLWFGNGYAARRISGP
jgi:hypothetical protein